MALFLKLLWNVLCYKMSNVGFYLQIQRKLMILSTELNYGVHYLQNWVQNCHWYIVLSSFTVTFVYTWHKTKQVFFRIQQQEMDLNKVAHYHHYCSQFSLIEYMTLSNNVLLIAKEGAHTILLNYYLFSYGDCFLQMTLYYLKSLYKYCLKYLMHLKGFAPLICLELVKRKLN